MSKPICMATWRYKKPNRDGHRGLKSLLKYVTFREDAHLYRAGKRRGALAQ